MFVQSVGSYADYIYSSISQKKITLKKVHNSYSSLITLMLIRSRRIRLWNMFLHRRYEKFNQNFVD
jgi:hypothetical protein